MTDPRFSAHYRDGLKSFVEDPGERRLQAAYELGRAGVQSQLSVLDVAAAYTTGVLELVEEGAQDTASMLVAAGDFLVESLAAFEMVQRGATEARRIAFQERRRVRMLRELSNVLADKALLVDRNASTRELAQIVAEFACEMTRAAECLVRLPKDTWGSEIVGRADEQQPDTWSELLGPSAEDINDAADSPEGVDVIAAPLSSMTGGVIGRIEATSPSGAVFRADDRETLNHIAEMTAAALDRLRLVR